MGIDYVFQELEPIMHLRRLEVARVSRHIYHAWVDSSAAGGAGPLRRMATGPAAVPEVTEDCFSSRLCKMPSQQVQSELQAWLGIWTNHPVEDLRQVEWRIGLRMGDIVADDILKVAARYRARAATGPD